MIVSQTNPKSTAQDPSPGPSWNLVSTLERFRAAAPDWFAQRESGLIAVVLGSGLGGLADSIEQPTTIRYEQIPGFPAATATGHRGEFLLGRLAGARIIAMAGRLHAYEGHSLDSLTRGMSIMAALAPSAVVVSCAAGGLNPRYQIGDLVIIDEHLCLLHGQMGASCIDTSGDEHDPMQGFRRSLPTCDQQLATIAEQTSRKPGSHFSLKRGTYLAVNGPNYETRAECRMMRKWGVDLVGMSTVPELILASRQGLRAIGIAVVTNMAIPDAPATASHDDVLAVSTSAGVNLHAIVHAIARSIGPASNC
jgi:purine-nucleoside phosphorylase